MPLGAADRRPHPLRPVLMTALAMLIGMLPMSLALGEGGRAECPRTGARRDRWARCRDRHTLFFVPVMYSLMRRRTPKILTAEQEA